jgi:hypothetical protein
MDIYDVVFFVVASSSNVGIYQHALFRWNICPIFLSEFQQSLPLIWHTTVFYKSIHENCLYFDLKEQLCQLGRIEETEREFSPRNVVI